MSAQDSDTQLNNRQKAESLLKKWFRKKEVLLRRLFRERFLGVVYLDCKTCLLYTSPSPRDTR